MITRMAYYTSYRIIFCYNDIKKSLSSDSPYTLEKKLIDWIENNEWLYFRW